jgi:coproporphyrinogen III oxidase-like Fe-S oxidoreductase
MYHLSKKEQIQEFLLMGFRLVNGISLSDFYNRFYLDLNLLTDQVNGEYFEWNGDLVCVKEKYFDTLNTVIVDLFIILDNYYS